MLDKLTQIFGVSGREKEIAAYIAEVVKPYVDEIKIDALGNVITFKKGTGAHPKKIMASAHIDEIGFMVTKITDDGYLKVRAVGGISMYTSYANRIEFQNGVKGCLMTESNIAEIGKNDVSQLYVDIGATSKEDAEKYIRVGDTAHYIGECVELVSGRYMSKSFDDRVAAYVLIQSIQQIKECPNDLYYVFSTQEEVGLRGARVAAQGIHPDIGIALDVAPSFDTPDNKNGNLVLGGGAAVKVMDSSVICDEDLVNRMVDVAERDHISYQLEVLTAGGTDAGAINQSNDGVRCCGISIPNRYVHAPVSIVDIGDVNACTSLLTAFVCESFEF